MSAVIKYPVGSRNMIRILLATLAGNMSPYPTVVKLTITKYSASSQFIFNIAEKAKLEANTKNIKIDNRYKIFFIVVE